jgi:hypothetical protein
MGQHSVSDRSLFETLLKRRYPNITFGETAMQHIYRGWWLHKAHSQKRIKQLEQTIARQAEQLEQFLERTR